MQKGFLQRSTPKKPEVKAPTASPSAKLKPSSSDSKKASFDKIPDDTVAVIVEYLRQLSITKGSKEQKDKALLLRDSTIRSALLSSKKAYNLFGPYILQDVTFTTLTFLSFYRFLNKNEENGKLVKSLHCIDKTYTQNQRNKMKWEYWELPYRPSPHPDEPKKEIAGVPQIDIEDEFTRIRRDIRERLVNLQELIIEDWKFIFPFRQKIDGKSVPMKFMTNSLKKLYIPLQNEGAARNWVNIKNVVWLLTFCPHLVQAALNFDCSVNDLRFLRDHGSAFRGKSNVKELSLRILFPSAAGIGPKWNKGQKTEAMMRLLQVTKNLTSLELYGHRSQFQGRDPSEVEAHCLVPLSSSYDTLKHLRIFAIGADMTKPESCQFSQFKNLKTITFDLPTLFCLSSYSDISLPDSLETLCLGFHLIYETRPVDEHYGECESIVQIMQEQGRSLKNLKYVAVPAEPFNQHGEIQNAEHRRAYNKGIRTLQAAKRIKNEQVSIIKLPLGHTIADSGPYSEPYLSTLRWMSS